MTITRALLFAFVLFIVPGIVISYGRRPMSKIIHDTILSIIKGKFTTPVRERSTEQRAAWVQYYRNKNKYNIGNDGKTLLYNSKKVITADIIHNVVNRHFEETKGTGCRKLQNRLREVYAGVSEANVKRILSKSKIYQRLRAKFTNKPVIRPIKARNVQARHQIDLVDMNRLETKYKGIKYRYVLSVLDVFSRFVWLRPLSSKQSKEIAKNLMKVYIEHGPPRVLQHDRGKEFEGIVKLLMKNLKVKIIRSSAYHPQSQGKIERMHREFKRKLMYDLLHMKKTGVNWVHQLPKYNSILNEEPKEELAWKSPFKVYFGRQNNKVIYSTVDGDFETLYDESLCGFATLGYPNSKELSRFHKNQIRLRKSAAKATRRINQRTIRRQKSKNPTPIYNLNEKVLIKYKNVKHKIPKKYHVIEGIIRNRNLKLDRYKVEFIRPNTEKTMITWFSVSDITSLTWENRNQYISSHHQLNNKHKRKYYIPQTHGDSLQAFYNAGFYVQLDPTPNGNCQFEALAEVLRSISIHRSVETIRQEIVNDLRNNPLSRDGTPLAHFVENSDFESYLRAMQTAGTYGDDLTLQRASELFHINFLVVSNLGLLSSRLITPSEDPNGQLPTLALGHMAEGHGEHYVSLQGNVNNYIQLIRGDDVNVNSDSDSYMSSSNNNTPVSSSVPNNVINESDSDTLMYNHQAFISDVESDSGQFNLPVELLQTIIKYTITDDCGMINSLNRVSTHFQRITSQFCPRIHIGQIIADKCGLSPNYESVVSIRKLIRLSGKWSGLSLRLRELFGQNSKWINGWLSLSELKHGECKIMDIFWK